jgi:hypothetical protein
MVKRVEDTMIETLNYHRSEAALYSRFIKYDKMDSLLAPYLSGVKEINIFIDFTQMLSSIYRFEDIANPLGLLASMLNMPLHYRGYMNRKNIKSHIFLVYSTNNSVNNYRFIASYDHKHKMQKESNVNIHSVIENNINLMISTVKYMPGIYLRTGTVECTVMIADLIDKFTRNGQHNIPNLVITGTDYAFQLPSIMGNVIMLYKASEMFDKKLVDSSFVVTHANALYAYIQKTKNKQLESLYQDTPLNQTWVGAFMTLAGLACRNIKSLCSYREAINILKYIESNYNVITPDSLYNAMVDIAKKPIIFKKEEIENRFCAIDLDYQLKLYRQLPESLEYSFLQDLNNPQALYDLTTKYFNRNNTVDFWKL